MKRRSFLALLTLSPLAPVAVKAEETAQQPKSAEWDEGVWDQPTVTFKANWSYPSELQKLRVADARRAVPLREMGDADLPPNEAWDDLAKLMTLERLK